MASPTLNMALLSEISLAVWKGGIPVELVIADDDLSSSTSPNPCFLFLPRMSYLGVVAADSVDYLKSFAIDLASDVWFESEGSPLKCNIPVGVLFDLHCSQAAIQPWKVVVHFRDFPADKILKCSTRESAEKTYMHTLKQALFVLQGNTRAFNAMVLEQQQLLWEGSNSGSRGLFESIAADLRGFDAVKCIPIRILYKLKEKVDTRNASKCDNNMVSESCTTKNAHSADISISCIQKPVHVFKNQKGGIESETLLLDVLEQFLPNIFSNSPSQTANILIHGVAVPLNSPMLQLWKSCAHADLFLYIIVSHN